MRAIQQGHQGLNPQGQDHQGCSPLRLNLSSGKLSQLVHEPLALSYGGYGSMTEARAACSAWADKGGRILRALDADDEPYKSFIRGCGNEEATRQVLGYDIPGAQAGTTYIGDGHIYFGK